MSKYIDTEKLIAEIERRIDSWSTREKHAPVGQGKDTCISRVTELSDLLSFVNSLQQEQPEVDLENYISNKLRELGTDLINHKPYSFNRGLNVGKTNAYNDILDRLNTRKE